MIRITSKTENYITLYKVEDHKWRINFDYTDLYTEDESGQKIPVIGLAEWTQHDYYTKPTNLKLYTDILSSINERYQTLIDNAESEEEKAEIRQERDQKISSIDWENDYNIDKI